MSSDPPYPELKKRHTMAHTGRPWRDYKPPPSGPVWAVIQAGSAYWMLVAAIDLGVFDALEESGSSTATALAERLAADATYLAHLLDCMATLGFLDQVDGIYELTETAERYLCRTGAASMADLIRVSPGPLENWLALADTIRNGTVATPIENDIAGFYGPLVQATFATQHRVASRLGASLGWPRLESLRALDLGAGCAPWSVALLEQSSGSSAVINDLPEIIGLAQDRLTTGGYADRVEYRPGDFHEIEIPENHFDLVFLGHVCRTEGPQRAPKLIRRAVSGLKPGGKLVVADYFADNDRKLNAFGVQMGMTMLANTTHGRVLTHDQMRGWLADEQLEQIRLVEPIGVNFVYTASKA